MNICNYSSLPIPIPELPPVIHQLSHEVPRATVFLLIPTELLYFSIYFLSKKHHRAYEVLTILSLATFWISPYVAPISCGPARCLQNFAIAIGSMKLLDIWARRKSLPVYVAGKRPADWLFALIVLTELRYESFQPNHIRVPKHQENFNEPLQLGIHVLAFTFLQNLPQNLPTVLAFEVQLAIYIIWTSIQMMGSGTPTDSAVGVIAHDNRSETWHNGFASPCTSLAYRPLRNNLPKYGVPDAIARSLGVFGAFGLMAIFHIYALYPILSHEALKRIGIFFMLNGVATVAEGAIWGKRRHWFKAALAWIFQTTLASWTANGLNIPNGLSRIPWQQLCDAPKY